MIELLKQNWWTVADLTAELAVTERTVWRYFDLIERVGAFDLIMIDSAAGPARRFHVRHGG
jgi:predicted DNA-binding transcriptional regulator YafY